MVCMNLIFGGIDTLQQLNTFSKAFMAGPQSSSLWYMSGFLVTLVMVDSKQLPTFNRTLQCLIAKSHYLTMD